MRKLLFGVLLVPLAVAAACVGSDPEPVVPPAADTGTSSGGTGNTGTSSGGTSSGGTSSGGTSGDIVPVPDCARITVTTIASVDDAGQPFFDGAEGITVMTTSSAGALLVADANHFAIREVDQNGKVSNYSDGGLGNPKRLAFESTDVFVADSQKSQLLRVDAIRKVSSEGIVSSISSVGAGPKGAKFVGSNVCYVATMADGGTRRFAGPDDGCGFADGTRDTARFQSQLVDFAFDVTDAEHWRMFVADLGNHAIRTVDQDGTVKTLAGGPDAGTFLEPRGVVYEPGRKALFVADKTRVLRVADGKVGIVAGRPLGGLEDGTGCEAQFNALKGITYYANALYVVDSDRIRKIKLPSN